MLRQILLITLLVWNGYALAHAADESPRAIGSRVELFVDDWLIGQMENVSLKLATPIPREVAIRFNQPWEGVDTAYVTVFQDGDLYRMYYRGNPLDQPSIEFACYAESRDGINWTKPKLGQVKYQGSDQNNILTLEGGTHNFTPFKDANPNAPADQRYKAVGGGPLLAFVSPDGLHWKILKKDIITKGAFDSQNLVYWDTERKEYRAFFRGFRNDIRDILTSSSADFVNWTEPQFVDYGSAPAEHFYTNAITPYFRAPHLLVGFPKRFVPDRTLVTEQPHTGVSDAVFMTSRDNLHWDRRFLEAFIRPGLGRLNWMHRSNMTAWGLLQTGPQEISLYCSENYNTPQNQLRRYTLRLDGFASVQAGAKPGLLETKPLTFTGKKLVINYSTSAAGSVAVEITDAAGKPISGFTFADGKALYGDETERTVSWKAGDVSALAGKPVRLRFKLHDADLYSLRFAP